MPLVKPPREISALALGTYYPPKVTNTPDDADALRTLAWLVKNKYPRRPRVCRIDYPGHPSGQQVLRNQAKACAYIAKLCAARWARICEELGLPANGQLDLVPIPSSEVTADTLLTARWGARDLARALAARGLGKAVGAVVNRVKLKAAHETEGRHTASKLHANFQARRKPTQPVLLIDDILTQGRHVAAMDEMLKAPDSIAVLAVGFTEAAHCDSCLSWLAKTVSRRGLLHVRATDPVRVRI
jgi:hypothetical protein